jgi:hypothetical protein
MLDDRKAERESVKATKDGQTEMEVGKVNVQEGSYAECPKGSPHFPPRSTSGPRLNALGRKHPESLTSVV